HWLTPRGYASDEDVGTKADRSLTATRVPQQAARLGGGTMRSGPGANRYSGRRLPNYIREPEDPSTPRSASLVREVRGDRAGRTPTNGRRLAQNRTPTPSRAIELWI